MSGPDTSRGMNFQYACTIGFILDFPLYPDWQLIQMEGEEDIEDILIYGENDHVLLRVQIKQKEDPYQWQPNELRDVFRAFANCSAFDDTEYQFVYAGSEGPAVAKQLKPILFKLYHEGHEALSPSEAETLSKNFSNEIVEFLLKAGNRLSLEKRESWESVEAKDLRKLRRLLAQNRTLPLEEDYEQVIYNDAFRHIAQKTEKSTKYFRRLTRNEIYKLLQIEEAVSAHSTLDITDYIHFLKVAVKKWAPIIPLELQEAAVLPDVLSFVIRVEADSTPRKSGKSPIQPDVSLPLTDTIDWHHQLVLVGEPGSGKTVSLWYLALRQCEDLEKVLQEADASFSIPVIISLAGYDGVSITELIYRSFHTAGQIITVEAINDLAKQGRLTLLFDDFDVAKTYHLPDLLLHLKNWIASHRKCSVVITTHRPADGHNLGLSTFRLRSLGRSQAEQILTGLPGIEQGDILTILEGLPGDSTHLTTSPLTLRMMAYFYLHSNQQIPQSRSPLYQEVIKGMLALNEEKGLIEFDRSDKVNLLTLLAKWMQDTETYVVSPAKVSFLIGSWTRDPDSHFQLAHLQYCDQLHLRTELVQSGLLRITVDGDIEFIHPTFRAYFASLAISGDELPTLIDKNSWRNSLILWASLRERRETDMLVDLVSPYPILLGQLIRERAEKRDEIVLSKPELQRYFEQLKQFFNELAKQFSMLLKDPPWTYIIENRLELLVVGAAATGYTLIWYPSNDGTNSVKWTSWGELSELVANTDQGFPLPVWLLPEEVIRKYHPLEVAYLWVMRALFDLLVFIGWSGGLDVTRFGHSANSHPAVPLIANRFLLYQEFATKLPPEIQDKLPFYATKEYDLAIEVHAYLHPAAVHYAVTTGRDPGRIGIIQSILQKAEEVPSLFGQDENGDLYFRQGDQWRVVSSVEEVDMAELMINSPAFQCQKWLKDDLERILPYFPPQLW